MIDCGEVKIELLGIHRLEECFGCHTAVAASLQRCICRLDCETTQKRRIGLASAGGGANPRKRLLQFGISSDGNSRVLGGHGH